MKFIIWFIKNSLFHILVLLTMLITAIMWDAALDRTIAICMTLFILLVLIGGKLYYYNKNVKQ